MTIRSAAESDVQKVAEAVAAQNLDYNVPPLRCFIETVVAEEGNAFLAVAARPTVELYLFAKPDGATPGVKLAMLRELHREMAARLRGRGITDAHLWMPPQLVRSFGRRLEKQFGWERLDSEWPCFTRGTGGI